MEWKSDKSQKLIEAILSLETGDEARRFLRDLMTEKEIEEFANRLEAARLLTEKVPYTTIVEKTGLSSTTVARVAKWLKGKQGGYKSILNKLHHSNLNTPAGRELS